MFGLVRLELFKIRKRWMPWVLLIVMVAFLALGQFGMFAGYQSLKAAPLPESEPPPFFLPPEQREEILRHQEEAVRRQEEFRKRSLDRMAQVLTFPRALESPFGMGQSVGGILLIILAASVIGGEYAWGTVRSSIVRGVGRCSYLVAKLTALVLLALLGLLIVFALGAVFAGVTSYLVEGRIDWGFLSLGLAGRLLAMVGRTWFVLLVPILMAGMVAVLTRSSAVAIGVGIAYPLLEAIVIAILAQIAGWGETVRLYTIGYNINSLMLLNSLGEEPIRVGINLGIFPAEEPSLLKSGGILLGYLLAFLLAMFYSFRRRDLTG